MPNLINIEPLEDLLKQWRTSQGSISPLLLKKIDYLRSLEVNSDELHLDLQMASLLTHEENYRSTLTSDNKEIRHYFEIKQSIYDVAMMIMMFSIGSAGPPDIKIDTIHRYAEALRLRIKHWNKRKKSFIKESEKRFSDLTKQIVELALEVYNKEINK